MQGQHGRPSYAALGRLQNHVRLREIHERKAFVDQSIIMTTNAVQQSSQEVLKIDEKNEHDDGPQPGKGCQDDERGESSPKHNCNSANPGVHSTSEGVMCMSRNRNQEENRERRSERECGGNLNNNKWTSEA